MSTTVELHRVKAELAALRAGIEALADEWERTTVRARVAFLVAADELRNLLDADA